jgi:uncharacterized protein with FMN-binding domain
MNLNLKKPAPLVIGCTVLGLVGVLSFNTSPVKLSLGALPAATVAPSSTTSTRVTTTTARVGGSPPPPTKRVTTTTVTVPPTVSRSATGVSSNYSYGILSVKVTVSGSTITNISIASIDDGGNPRSAYIDQASLPLLEQQALSAQSANIQGVSGASYTTAGFEQSLQSALSQLGL